MLRPLASAPAVIVCAMLLQAQPASAHPHVWVTVSGHVEVGPKGVAAMVYRWRFDEAFSAFALQGLDTDNDGQYSREELQPLAEINVSSLADYDYFTQPVDGDVAVLNAFDKPTDYWLDWDGKALTLNFTLPAAEPIDVTKNPIAIEVFDPEYYIDFEFAEGDAMPLAEGAPAGCTARLERPTPLDPGLATQLSQVGVEEAVPSDRLNQLSQTGGFVGAVIVECKKG